MLFLSWKSKSLVSVSFSKILPQIGKTDIGLQFVISSLKPPLCTGVTIACFTWSGKISCEKLSLYSVDKVYETDKLNVLRKVADIPYISLDFLLLREFMCFATSSLVVGLRNIDSCTCGSRNC